MTTVVSGLVKIGKTGTDTFEKRMYNLERNGYCNVVGLERKLAIEVQNYDDKEILLHTIFAKSRVEGTELFALDVNIALQLLSAFEENIIYPKDENKGTLFTDAVGSSQSKLIPDGEYFFKRRKGLDDKYITATALVKDGSWTILKGSELSFHEGVGLSKNVRTARANMSINAEGILTDNFELGVCSPSFAGYLVLYQSCNGWTSCVDKNGVTIDRYRKQFTQNDLDD